MATDQINEKKLSVIRRYPMEFLVSLLICAVVFVSFQQAKTDNKVDQLQNEMKQYLSVDRAKAIETLFNNTETMKNTNTLLINLQHILEQKTNR